VAAPFGSTFTLISGCCSITFATSVKTGMDESLIFDFPGSVEEKKIFPHQMLFNHQLEYI
jgi:hypothetical protein